MRPPPKKSIVLVRSFSASPAEVWRAWTDPGMMRKWFGSEPEGVVLHARADLRIGGSFEVTFVNPDGTEHTCFGTYRAIEPASRLVFTWAWKVRPSKAELVTVALEPEGEGTVMTFEHADIDPGTSHDYAVGWKSTFDKLERALR